MKEETPSADEHRFIDMIDQYVDRYGIPKLSGPLHHYFHQPIPDELRRDVEARYLAARQPDPAEEKLRRLALELRAMGSNVTYEDLDRAANAPMPEDCGIDTDMRIPAKGKRPEQWYAVKHTGPNRRERRAAERKKAKR